MIGPAQAGLAILAALAAAAGRPPAPIVIP